MELCSLDQNKFTICLKLLRRNKNKIVIEFPLDTLLSTFDDYFHKKLTSTLRNLPLYNSLITTTLPIHLLNVCIINVRIKHTP